MNKNKDLLRTLTKYFIMSTLIPFLIIILISVTGTTSYYRKELLNVTDTYVSALSREASMYTNQLKQILITPNWSTAASNKIRDINQKNDLTIMDKEEFEQIMGSLISSIRYTGNDFFSALITNGRDVIYSSSNYLDTTTQKDMDWYSEDWFQKAINNPQKIHFIPRHIPDYYDGAVENEVLSLVTTVRNLITQEPYAVIKLDFLPSKLSKHIDLNDFNVKACAYIVDDDGNLIEETHSAEKMKLLQERHLEGEDISKQALIIKKAITGTPYTLTVLLDIWAIRYKSLNMLLIGILLYSLALLTAILLNRRFTRRVTAPIEQMKTVFSQVQQGDFTARYIHKKNCELEDLGLSLNIMTEKLESNIKKTYLAEIAEKEAVNQALLSQIRPHFLFNTLNTMIGLLYEERYEELENNIFALSDIMRSVLSKEQTWELSKEIEFLDEYMRLQQSRFRDRLEWKVTMDPAIGNVFIPRLLIQPLIENSVIHGMEPSGRKCTVSLECYTKDRKLFITVIDNGVGFDPMKIDLSSVGLSNSRNRLKLFYSNATMTIKSEPGKGCCVTMEINMEDELYEDSDC